MKRKSFSSIFSTKTLGIILFIVLGVFSLGMKKTEASILLDINLNKKSTKILVTKEKDVFWTAVVGYPGRNELRVVTNEGLGRTYTVSPLDPIYTTEVSKLIDERTASLGKEIRDSELAEISKLEKLVNAIEDKSYPEANDFLLGMLEEAKKISSSQNYNSLYEAMKNHSDELNVYQESSLKNVIEKIRRIYIYRSITSLLTTGATSFDVGKIPEEVRSSALAIRNNQETVGTNLTDPEKSSGDFYYHNNLRENIYLKTLSPFTGNVSIENPGEGGDVGGNINNPESEILIGAESQQRATVCESTGLWGVMQDRNCSVAAFLVNLVLDGILTLLGGLVKLVGDLFDWVIHFSIYNFNDWVVNSNAYFVWRNVILSLVTSLLLPIVFYMIIRMLIDNDTSRIKKILPRILVTALFVYFSFAIVGWIIDQTNVLSIYIYRSMHDPQETLGTALSKILNIDTKAVAIPKADWNTTLFQLIKIVVNGVSLLVLIQGMVLLLMRAIILLLVLIFSPLMLLPAGINEYIDKYRDMVIKNFTNSVISAPIFMFIVLIAMQIGEAIRDSLETNAQLNNIGRSLTTGTVTASPADTMGATIASVVIIVVLQLAITVSKKLSGEIGGQVAGKVSGFVGGLAFGGTAAVARGGVRALSNNEKFKGWMQKNEGTRTGKVATNLLNTAKSSTFDVRNTSGFQRVSQAATGDKASFGQGTKKTVSSAQEQEYVKERKYHNSLTTEEGKERNIKRLRNPVSGGLFGKEIANRLQGKEAGLTFKERVENENGFEKKLDKATKVKNEDERIVRTKDIVDQHYKDNGKGDKHFTQALEKPENERFKKGFEDANKKEDINERKDAIAKLMANFEAEEKRREKMTAAKEAAKEANQKSTTQTVGNETKTGAGKQQNINEKITTRAEAKDRSKEASDNYQKAREAEKSEGKERYENKQMRENISRMAKATEETKAELINMNKNVSSLIGSLRSKSTNPNKINIDEKINEKEKSDQAA